MSIFYNDYDVLYPDLVYEIIDYFLINNTSNGSIAGRCIFNFCEKYKDEKDNYIYDPLTIRKICDKLCQTSLLTHISYKGGLGLNDQYISVMGDADIFKNHKSVLKYHYNAQVYGFEYIYNLYKEIVVPLVWEKEDGSYAMGTGFKYLDGIITAKHCISDAKNLKIRGYQSEDFVDEKSGEKNLIFVSENKGVDIAFIQTKDATDPILLPENGEIMEEVLVMGYPRIPTFTDFLTAERATISSKAEARITPTKGAIAAKGFQYMSNLEALLITAKIKGGNSGGPVINQRGSIVGIACQVPDFTNNENNYYDDLGYGIAVPFKYAQEIISCRNKKLEVPKDFFCDYE